MRQRVLIAAALILASASGVLAQHAARRGAEGPQFERLDEGVITLPFRLTNNHLVFAMTVNGKPVDVVLDTGMPMNGLLLFDNAQTRTVGLEFGPERAHIGGAGGEDLMEARIATGVTMGVGSARMHDAMVVVPPPLPHFDGYVDGIVGASLFDRFVVHIDYDRQEFELHEPATFSPPAGATTLPLEFDARKPFASVTIARADGTERSLDVVVDLGASHAISINLPDTTSAIMPADTLTTVLGRGLKGPVEGRVGRVRQLELAGFAFENVVATFPQADHQSPGGMNSRDGNLGSEILKRFNVSIDYPGKRMFLIPNDGFAAPFEWDMSGMRLTPYNDSMRVDAVIAKSPAARAGIAVNDVVTHVDGKPVTTKDSETVRRLMQRKGQKVTVTVERDGEPRTVELVLRRLV